VALRNGYVVRRCHRSFKIPGRPLGGICPAGPPWPHRQTASARAPAIPLVAFPMFVFVCSRWRCHHHIASHRSEKPCQLYTFLPRQRVCFVARRPTGVWIYRSAVGKLQSAFKTVQQVVLHFLQAFKVPYTHTHTYLTYLTRAHTYVCALQQQRK